MAPHRPIRVWQVLPDLSWGGAEKLVCTLHAHFIRAGIEDTVVALTGPCPPEFEAGLSLKARGPYQSDMPLRLARLLHKAQLERRLPDIIHTHLTPCQAFIPLALRLSGCASVLVTTQHSTSNRRKDLPFGLLADRILFSAYQTIVCVSAGVRDAMTQRLPTLGSRLRVIQNGIEFPSEAVSRAPDMNSPIEIISVGRLSAAKNYAGALQAIALLKGRNVVYTIVGSGPEERQIENLIRSLQIEDKVRLYGWRADIEGLLNKAHIFLMPSNWEGFGLAALEAMASGLPFVVSDIPGLREVGGEDGVCGYLIDPNDPRMIAERLAALIESPETRESMGKNGMRRALEFDIRHAVASYVCLYTELAGKSRGCPGNFPGQTIN